MVRDYLQQKALTLGQQMFRMKSICPRFRCALKRSCVTWTGAIQPTEISSTYLVRINYVLGRRPTVVVVDPPLQRRNGTEKIPHLFPDNDLCLYHPRYGEWLATMFIADTIVPWAALWLYYYEVWHATGEWLGGGEHPRVRERKHGSGK